jgi:hypothetical protein
MNLLRVAKKEAPPLLHSSIEVFSTAHQVLREGSGAVYNNLKE